MDLLTPGIGLIVWQTIVFLALFFFLAKVAWKPILGALKEREMSIQQALDAAEQAKLEMKKLQGDNDNLLREARIERDKIIKEAREAAGKMLDQTQTEAKKSADKIIQDAKAVISVEKQAALRDVREQVAMFSLEISERLLKKNLSSDQSQKDLVNTMIKDLKLN